MSLFLFYLFLLLMTYGPWQDFALAQGKTYKLPEVVVTATKTVHTIEESYSQIWCMANQAALLLLSVLLLTSTPSMNFTPFMTLAR